MEILAIILPLAGALAVWAAIYFGADLYGRRRVRKIQRNWARLQSEARHGALTRTFEATELPEPPGEYEWMLDPHDDHVTLRIITLEEDEDGDPVAIIVHGQVTIHLVDDAPQAALDEMVAMAARRLLENVDQCD
jgi:hypothetical protein